MICIENDCRKEFELTTGEEEFFAMKGLAKPKRCKDCRAKRKANGASNSRTSHNNDNPVLTRRQARELKGGMLHQDGGEGREY